MKTKDRSGKLEHEAGMCMKTKVLSPLKAGMLLKTHDFGASGESRDCGDTLLRERQDSSAWLARGMRIVLRSRCGSESKYLEWTLNWVTIGHNFPLLGLGGVANATLSSLEATRVLGICLLSLQNGQGLRLRNATQTNPSLTIGWQKNCSPEHLWGLSKRKIWPCRSELQASGIQE
jgi:hypothetical protein